MTALPHHGRRRWASRRPSCAWSSWSRARCAERHGKTAPRHRWPYLADTRRQPVPAVMSPGAEGHVAVVAQAWSARAETVTTLGLRALTGRGDDSAARSVAFRSRRTHRTANSGGFIAARGGSVGQIGDRKTPGDGRIRLCGRRMKWDLLSGRADLDREVFILTGIPSDWTIVLAGVARDGFEFTRTAMIVGPESDHSLKPNPR